MRLINADMAPHKKEIRDTIRRLPDGEKKWQQVQAQVYGKAMDEAVLFDGVQSFFDFCKNAKISTYIVSHKTQYASGGQEKIDLRRVALKWMEKNKFFENDGLGLSPSRVYFEPTREQKIERIKALGCTHFIDDLEETFLEESFPLGVDRILYSPHKDSSLLRNVKVFKTWLEIEDYFYAKRI